MLRGATEKKKMKMGGRRIIIIRRKREGEGLFCPGIFDERGIIRTSRHRIVCFDRTEWYAWDTLC